jgi:NitT/TauT family transport system substrate-binding protein
MTSYPGSPSTSAKLPWIGKVSAMLAAVAIFQASPSAAQDKVTFGTAGQFGDASAAIAIAVERGWFGEAGIEARVLDFRGGAPAVQALVGGGITYCICAPEHAVRLRNRGLDGIIAFALDRRHTYALLTTESSPVRGLADLRGQRVGITSPGSLTENLLRLALGRAGLQAGADVELVGAGVGGAQKAALDTGRTAAGMFGNLDALQLSRQGYRVVFDWRDRQIPSLGLIGRQSWQDENEALARRALAVVRRAQAALLDDRALAVSTLRRLYPALPDEVVEEVATSLPGRLSRDGIYSAAEVEALQDDLIAVDPSIQRVGYDALVPTRLLQQATR